MNKLKKLVFDAVSNSSYEVELTEEELIQREADSLSREQEQAKPNPPTIEERLASLEEAKLADLGL